MGLENPIDAAIHRLSRLSPLEYDQVRREEAKTLRVRSAVLDAAVRNARKQEGSDDLPFPVVEPGLTRSPRRSCCPILLPLSGAS